MRVLVWPADEQGSGNYRLRFPAAALAAQGADVEVSDTGPKVGWDMDWEGQPSAPLDAHITSLVEKPDADIVVIQRPGRAHWAELIPHLQAAGCRVVVDVDDDFDAIPAGNIAAGQYDPKVSPRHNRDWIRRACDLADLVTVSTRPLAGRYGRPGRVTVLPNLIPESYLTVDPGMRFTRAIGWSGSVDTHPGDLESTAGAVADVLAKQPSWSVHAVGTGKGVSKRLALPAHRVSATGTWLPFDAYPAELARLTVGIVPLRRSRFNTAKSCLKMMEMSAVGVPTVAARTPDNKRLHTFGVGLLADGRSQWRDQLTALTASEDYRTEVAGRSREAMAAHTYEQWAELWWCAWETALDAKKAA